MRSRHVCLLLSALTALGCGSALASRARTRYVARHGILPQPSEIRVAEFLSDYREDLPDPSPHAAGLTVEAARAAWADERPEPPFVVQTAIRGRNPDVRPPMALMVVVDRSGSMAEADKMTYVREGLHRLVDRLDPRDAVGLVAFDHRAELVLPVTPVAEGRALHRAIDTLAPGGATNLTAGLEAGYGALARWRQSGHLRRVVLLTDAVANVGETDLSRIADWAARGDEAGIRLSAVGVGLAHRDEVLVEMARRGRGNHYFLDSPRRIERVFEREVHGLLEDVADRVRLTFAPAPGVEVVRVEGAEARPTADGWAVELGRLGAAQHRVVLWTLRGVPEEARTPAVGRFALDFVDARTGEPRRLAHAEPVFVVARAAQGTVARNAAVAWMARDLRRVVELARAGRPDQAQRRLDRIRAVVRAVGRARPHDPELADDLAMLEDFARTLAAHTGRPVRRLEARLTLRVGADRR
jgi:Mg-chelatase subunit ChlD